MFTYSRYPAYFPGTDVRVIEDELNIRVFASGDDRRFWDVQFQSPITERWHTVPAEHCKAVLAYIEQNALGDWEDILATARTNPTLAA